MKAFIFLILFVGVGVLADLPKPVCDPGSTIKLMRYHDGENPSHEITIGGRTITVGGPGAKHSPDMDYLAVQTGLLYCSFEILDCLKKEHVALPVEFSVSFDLTASGELAKASHFAFSWKTNNLNRLNSCLSETWSKVQYGLIVDETKKVDIPVRVK